VWTELVWHRRVEGVCKQGNELLNSIIGRGFRDQCHDYWLLKKNSASQTYKLIRHFKNTSRPTNNKTVALVRELTISTERPPFFGDVNANFCG
jgi:hypothetical protein